MKSSQLVLDERARFPLPGSYSYFIYLLLPTGNIRTGNSQPPTYLPFRGTVLDK